MTDADEVNARFRIRALLGSGATASVYDALDTTTGDRVAVKVLHPHLADDPALARAFLREAEIVAGLSHPGLSASVARGDGATPSRSWTAWEFVEGVSLAETVRGSGALDHTSALTVAASLLDALQVLHSAGIVHRDISPANVLIARGADARILDVHLIDFGLSAPVGESARGADVLRSAAGEGVVGNASYASPEQLRGDPVGVAGDLYQVAGVLYFALAGTPPFPRSSVADTVRAHLTALPPTASVAAPGVPVAVDRLIVRALLKEPAERYPDARAMRAAIDPLFSTAHREPALPEDSAPTPTRVLTAARPLAPAPIEPEPRATSPWLWVLGAAAVTVVVAVIAAAALPTASGSAAAPAPAAPTAVASADPVVATPIPTPPDPVPTTPVAPTSVPMPEVRGLALADAAEALRRAGLLPGVVTAHDGPSAAQTVLAAGADVGVEVPMGSAVDLAVASGWTVVPEVASFAERDAVGLVSAAGLVPLVVREPRPGIIGAVVAVEPAVATRQVLGSTVTIVVATASVPSPTATPRPSATVPSPAPSS